MLPMVPQIVFDILSIIVFCIGAYYIGTTLIDINSRSKMNYDELDLTTLTSPAPGNTVAESSSNQGSGSIYDLIDTPNFCAKGDCCGQGTTWDKVNGVCVPGNTLVSGFTSLNFTNLSDSKHNISVNTPFEFNQYVPYR